jgi:hypothetical protein
LPRGIGADEVVEGFERRELARARATAIPGGGRILRARIVGMQRRVEFGARVDFVKAITP